ncbi:calmodulin-like protein [Hepatocystis sp. ex Piliocolobus tephrosceles]|nr:calmodulin-like protein [Hepatocystis sp. ex Piliocolobus tephrosceles]
MDKYKLSKERRDELEFIFNEFNKKKKGLDGNTLLYILKSMGIFLNKSESAALLDECKQNGNLNLNNFYAIMQEFYYDENIGKMIFSSLKKHTTQNANGIALSKLKNILLTLGSGVMLTEEEVDTFFKMEFSANEKKEILFDDFIHK